MNNDGFRQDTDDNGGQSNEHNTEEIESLVFQQIFELVPGILKLLSVKFLTY